jgi:hypothetical protein
MASTNTYGTGVLPSDDLIVLGHLCALVPYTNVGFGTDLNGDIHITVDETVNNADMKTALEGETDPGALTHDGGDPVAVTGDGVDTTAVVVTDPRGASANGKTVKLRVPSGVTVPLDKVDLVLAGVGQATITFGPLFGCLEVAMEFYYESGEATPVAVNLLCAP